MNETFELWDSASGNLIDEFGSEAEARASLRVAINKKGRGVVATLMLVRGVGNSSTVVGRGDELARFVGVGVAG